ncbi:MAG: Glu/Leu/Phe/Val dehydrogenase [Deltaproteobacteria bacterium]|nr:Glu/Leu/Phe/Val dehydrogenase [Deltaproteobacteria bacterium]
MGFDFRLLTEMGHEQVVFCSNPSVGLKAFIAIHNTSLGPALGGTRMYPYASEELALQDVLKLSKGMTYKSVACGLNFGGGKAVIIGDPKKDKSEKLFRTFGAFVDRLQGQFITGEDVGVDVNDIEFMFMETDYVVGLSKEHGGSGDPSFMTAYGLVQGLQACIEERLQRDSLEGLTVVIQGLGHVGMNLVKLLVQANAKVIACDVDAQRCELAKAKWGIELVKPSQIYEVPCDVFAPCAMGGSIHLKSLSTLECKIIAGSANNQLENETVHQLLKEKNILYAPDYVINAGGLINVALELEGYSERRARLLARNIYYNLKRVFEISKERKISPAEAADRLADERIHNLQQIQRSHFLDKSKIRRA